MCSHPVPLRCTPPFLFSDWLPALGGGDSKDHVYMYLMDQSQVVFTHDEGDQTVGYKELHKSTLLASIWA